MSTAARQRSRPARWRATLVAAILLTGLLAGCADDPPERDRPDPQADVVDAIERTLRQRARALAAEDRAAFVRTVGRGDGRFAAAQQQYYDNLAPLPLGTLRFELDAATLRPRGRAYWAEVTIRLELRGYDAAPVSTRDRWRFAPTRDGRRFVVTSTTDPGWERRSGSQPQPWDLLDVEVREGSGVLGVFDDITVTQAERVVDAVSAGRFEVRNVLPDTLEDPRGVVVYALGDPAYVESLTVLPVADPDRLDGATLPVMRRWDDGDGAVASYRVLLSPDVLDQDQQALGRLVRHELTHVALGDRARGVPLWLTEGLAEYVSVRPLAPADRRLQTEALELTATDIDRLPSDDAFSGVDAEAWYAVSWWVCEFIAAGYGEPALWALLAVLADAEDDEQAIADQLGISGSELVRRGVDLMRRTYG